MAAATSQRVSESTSGASGASGATTDKKASPKGPPKAIPRLPGNPLLGHLSEFRKNRVGLLRKLAVSHPEIVEMQMGLIIRRVVVTSEPSLANEVLTTKQSSFVKAPGLSIFLKPVLGDGLLTSEKAMHEKQRRLLAPAFAPKRITAYETTMAERAERFAMKVTDREEMDLSEAMMRLTFEIVGKTLFDTEVIGDAHTVGDALTVAMEVAMGQLGSILPIPPQIPTRQNRRYKRAVTQLDSVIYRIIRERRAQGGDRGDVLSMLLEARDEDGSSMTDKQVRDEAMTLFLAGHETTANALTWTFYLLAQYPEARAKMEAELDALGHTPSYEDLKQLPYTLAVFKESMRMFPPAYLLGRRAVEDVVIGDYLVKKGSIVLVSTIGLHYRADIWPNPEVFDPERFLGDREKQLPRCAYMPFGAGPRVCIGNHFAMMEGHALLATIARHVRFELTSDKPAELEPLVTLRPRNGLAVRARARGKGASAASAAPAASA